MEPRQPEINLWLMISSTIRSHFHRWQVAVTLEERRITWQACSATLAILTPRCSNQVSVIIRIGSDCWEMLAQEPITVKKISTAKLSALWLQNRRLRSSKSLTSFYNCESISATQLIRLQFGREVTLSPKTQSLRKDLQVCIEPPSRPLKSAIWIRWS